MSVERITTIPMLSKHSREQATALGLKRYFTGEPCKHGHIAERYVRSGGCLKCNCAKVAKWNAANRERINERARKHRAANPEKAGEGARRRKAANPEKAREYARRWYAKNKDRVRRQQAEWYARNKSQAARLAAITNEAGMTGA
jgi:hypothetical protein